MLQKFFSKTDILKLILKILFISAFCIGTVLFLFVAVAVIISKVDTSYDILFPVITAILSVSAVFCGFTISRWFKENGLIWGILAGIIISVFIISTCLIYGSLDLTTALFTKIIVTVISGAVGGIIGVNIN